MVFVSTPIRLSTTSGLETTHVDHYQVAYASKTSDYLTPSCPTMREALELVYQD